MAFVIENPTDIRALETDAAGNRTMYIIPEVNYSAFLKNLKKISNRSEKLTGYPITAVKIGEDFETVDNVTIRVFKVYLDAPVPTTGDWTFVARIDHTNETGNIVRRVPNYVCDFPDEYRTASPNCDHCGHKRMRRDTFVIHHREAGIYNQIGSTCLEKFFDHNPMKDAKLAELLGYADEVAKANREPQGGTARMHDRRWINVETFLAHVARAMRLHGWVSGAAAKQDRTLTSTRERAFGSYLNNYSPEFDLPSSVDMELAEEALNWAAGLSDNGKPINEYLHNINVVAASGFIEPRSIGLAASIVYAYKQNVRIEQAKPRVSEYVGTKGQRVKGIAFLTSVHSFEVDSPTGDGSATKYAYRFTGESGNVLVWFTFKDLDMKVNTKVQLAGTVKDHKTYKGSKETIVSHCKLEIL